jgi:hypothetical protein
MVPSKMAHPIPCEYVPEIAKGLSAHIVKIMTGDYCEIFRCTQSNHKVH